MVIYVYVKLWEQTRPIFLFSAGQFPQFSFSLLVFPLYSLYVFRTSKLLYLVNIFIWEIDVKQQVYSFIIYDNLVDIRLDELHTLCKVFGLNKVFGLVYQLCYCRFLLMDGQFSNDIFKENLPFFQFSQV